MKNFCAKFLAATLAVAMAFTFAACNKKTPKAELVLTGPGSLTLGEGYGETVTEAYRVDNLAATDSALLWVECEDDNRGLITFDDETNGVKVAPGLTIGTYNATVYAEITSASGEGTTLSKALTVTVTLPAIPEGDPLIEGVGYGAEIYGYNAPFVSERFVLYGTGVTVAVTKVTKDGEDFSADGFAWNAAERTLTIKKGLETGQYVVTLTASGTASDKTFDFEYTFVVDTIVAPVIDGPTDVTVSEGCISGTIDGFMAIGTGAYITLTATGPDETDCTSYFAYSAADLSYAGGLEPGVYTVLMRISNGTQSAEHTLNFTVAEAVEVSGRYVYTSGVEAADGTIMNEDDDVTAEVTSADGKFLYPAEVDMAERTVSAQLAPGEYKVTLSATKFNSVVEAVTVTSGGDNEFEATFSVPRLAVETGTNFAYTESGVFVPNGNTVYRPFAGSTSAAAGFTFKYTMTAQYAGDSWLYGGFCFRRGTTWYTMLIHPAQNKAGAVRINLVQNDEGQFRNVFYLATRKQVSGGTTALNVEIAYYDEAFYIRLNGDYAVRLGRELFEEERHCSGNAGTTCPIYFGADQYGYFLNPASHGSTYGTIVPDEFFGAGDRMLGIRALDVPETFTDISYVIGDNAAKALITSMRATADAMTDYPICSETHGNPWPTL